MASGSDTHTASHLTKKRKKSWIRPSFERCAATNERRTSDERATRESRRRNSNSQVTPKSIGAVADSARFWFANRRLPNPTNHQEDRSSGLCAAFWGPYFLSLSGLVCEQTDPLEIQHPIRAIHPFLALGSRRLECPALARCDATPKNETFPALPHLRGWMGLVNLSI
jgi:hypothetical protein